MKKIYGTFTAIFSGSPFIALAGTGSANDGILFILVLSGFLLCIAGILFLIDFFRHGGWGRMVRLTVALIHGIRRLLHRSYPSEPEMIQPHGYPAAAG